MCGVPGHWGADQGIGTKLVALLEGIHDLGPNDHETRIPSDMSVGATPLSVIDIACGLDPLHGEERAIATVLNGGIYDSHEIPKDLSDKGIRFTTRSDTEVFVQLSEEGVAETVDYLRGMFAVAVHDLLNSRLHLARDRFGKKPRFYRHHRDGLTFPSKTKALKRYSRTAGERWNVSTQAVDDCAESSDVHAVSRYAATVASTRVQQQGRFRDPGIVASHHWRRGANNNRPQLSDSSDAVVIAVIDQSSPET